MTSKLSLLTALTLVISINAYSEDTYKACIKWTAPWPDASKADVGLEVLSGVKHYTLFTGNEKLGMFNHGPMLAFYNDRLYATWFSHRNYEDSPGTRALFSYSEEKIRLDNSGLKQHQPIKWSKPQVLIDSIGEMTGPGNIGTGLWPTFEEINGKLYALATVKRMIDWKEDGNNKTPVYRDLPKIAKLVNIENPEKEELYWLSENSPEDYDFIKPYNMACNEELLKDLTALKKKVDEKKSKYFFAKTDDDAGFCEPTYFTRPDGKEVGIYRDIKRSLRLYAALRDKPGAQWSKAYKTNIPDSPSKCVAGSLPDGRIYIIGNNIDKLWLRDPIMISLSTDGVHFDKSYVIRCGASNCREKNPGDHKGPGFQYPDAIVIGDSLWVSYAISKEQIGVSRIPLESLK
ncbi:MAG: exo-alpha-sialidase [Sedimentisphaeraceae bacterium JB056]